MTGGRYVRLRGPRRGTGVTARSVASCTPVSVRRTVTVIEEITYRASLLSCVK